MFYRQSETLFAGIVIVPLALEALRRSAGHALLIIVLAFLAYGVLGHLIPGQFQGRSKDVADMLSFLAVDNVAILGISMTVVVKVVVLFVLMGQLLTATGGSTWFTEIASALMGRSRGGSAKIAVVASSLFGSISGSAVSNVVSTGVITIPMMKEAGFQPRVAGAIEAVASTGGQFMPPVMGAAAFLMAEFLEVPYRDVVIAALLPAVLYYVAVFVQIDIEAARNNIPPVPEDKIPPIGRVMREGWHFLLPFALLIVLLFNFNRTAEEAALAATLSIIVLSVLFGYRGQRISARATLNALIDAGRGSADLIMIGAMAGMIIAVLDGSGLGFALTFVLLQIGEGSLLGLLVVTAVICIVLGMGMPTTGIYLLLAALAAPSLVKLGVSPMGAHLFVLYFGCLSMITPPVALAAFAAANLANAPPMATGWAATRLGWTAFFIPFLFVASPSLLMQGAPVEIVLAAVTAFAGVWLTSAGFMRYLFAPLGAIKSLLFVAAGLSLFIPANAFPGAAVLDVAGAILGSILVAQEYALRRRRTSSAA